MTSLDSNSRSDLSVFENGGNFFKDIFNYLKPFNKQEIESLCASTSVANVHIFCLVCLAHFLPWILIFDLRTSCSTFSGFFDFTSHCPYIFN